MLKRIAEFVSVIFHPVFIFFYIYNYFAFYPSSVVFVRPDLAFAINLLIFFDMVILPVAFTYWLTSKLLLSERRDRFLPLIVTIVLYFITLLLLRRLPFPLTLSDYMVSLMVGMVFLVFINIKLKVSMHTTSLGSAVGFFFFLFFHHYPMFLFPLVLTILIAGIVGSARLILSAHTQLEIYLGYALGFFVTIGVMFIDPSANMWASI